VFRKISTLIVFSIFLLAAVPARAGDAMEKTLRDAVYGGIVGALMGAAVMAFTDEPEDHLGYIPAGAAAGVLAGSAYGFTTGVADDYYADAEVDEVGVEPGLQMPTVKAVELRDKRTDTVEVISILNIFRYRF